MILSFIKKVLKLSPIPLTRNHRYDLYTKKIINGLSENSNCIDVGCYKGEILDLMQSAAPKGQHFGIEPIPGQFNYLSEKYKNHKNCTILNYAASNEKGTSTFNYVKSNPPYSGLKKRDYDKPNEVDTTIDVSTDLIDNLIPDSIKVDLMKIDVEGAELLVLEGAKSTIEKNKPIVIFEHGIGASNHYDTTPEKVYDFFNQYSMKISTLKSFFTKKESLTREDFKRQYDDKINYYFVAHV